MSNLRRFFVQTEYPQNPEVIVSGDEFCHAAKVLRVTEGEEVVLLDGFGKEYSAIVTKVSKKEMTCHITGEAFSDKDPKKDIYLLCGALKGDKTELVIQKATELGATKIGIFRSKYCSAYFNDNRVERWERVSREAAKQCGRSSPGLILTFDDFGTALESAAGYENKLFFCEFETLSGADMSNLSGDSFAVVVGSEGGFSEDEYALAKEKYAFTGMSLGKRILRAETAAISAVTLVSYFAGELKS
ncbi:MAG: 16S rRNA (uracil(1498)-N(3))-methyltransferase [Clostridia bacterium]|nr:16S rRNA (uracil(1498)-N(3))-methyltransferase [Clostridia bacterium]